MLIVPGRRFLGIGHPQGIVPAPVGQVYVNEQTGVYYRKLGGGNTPFGWYRWNPLIDLESSEWRGMTRGPSTPLLTNVGVDQGTFLGSGFASIFPDTPIDLTRPWLMGYTTAVVGNVCQFRPTGAMASMPIVATQDNGLWLDWDATVYVRTTPRPTGASTATTIAGVRLVFGVLVYPNGLSAAGNSDLFNVYWGGSALNQGFWAAYIRFSTAVPDAGWVLVSGNDDGAAFSQTETPIPGIVAANTTYKLRMRYRTADAAAGIPFPGRLFGSVNDEPEVSHDTNVSPGLTPAPSNRPIQVHLNGQNLAGGVLKSIGYGGSLVQIGNGY